MVEIGVIKWKSRCQQAFGLPLEVLGDNSLIPLPASHGCQHYLATSLQPSRRASSNLSLLCLHTVFSSRHGQISLQGHFSLHLGSFQIIQGNPPISISLIGSHWQRLSPWFWILSGNIVTGSMD